MVTGPLARSAADFLQCNNIASFPEDESREFSISDMGIKLHARVYLDPVARTLLLPLQCATYVDDEEIAISLLYLGQHRYLRINPHQLYAFTPKIVFADVPVDGHLLRKPTLGLSVPREPSLWPTLQSVRLSTRHSLLQISRFYDTPVVFKPWPTGWYDHALHTFFVQHVHNQIKISLST